MDAEPPRLEDGRVHGAPALHELYPQLVELGLTTATRPAAVGGQQLPITVAALGERVPDGRQPVGLRLRRAHRRRAAHLIEAFGDAGAAGALHDAHVRRRVDRHDGAHRAAGRLEPRRRDDARDADRDDGALPSVAASKIFISGGDHDLTDNIVHMTLARIDGAPAGIKGVSLFCVPKLPLRRGRRDARRQRRARRRR